MFQKLHTFTLMERAGGQGRGQGNSERPVVGLPVGTTAALILPSVCIFSHHTPGKAMSFCHNIHSVNTLTIEDSLSHTFL